MNSKPIQLLVVAGSPQQSSPELLQKLKADSALLVACDSGAELCKKAKLVPDAWVGDADSIAAETLMWLQEKQVACERYPSEKDDTDLALGIKKAIEVYQEAKRLSSDSNSRNKSSWEEDLDKPSVVVTSAAGGRFDHALGVLGELIRFRNFAPRQIEDSFELRILSLEGQRTWKLPEEALTKTISVIPCSDNTVISEWGMRWNLEERICSALEPMGISNIMLEAGAEISLSAGIAAVMYMKQI